MSTQEGAYVEVIVKLGLIKLLTKRFDFCEEAYVRISLFTIDLLTFHLLHSRNANSSVQCPVQPGPYEVQHTVALPKEVPRGKCSKILKLSHHPDHL